MTPSFAKTARIYFPIYTTHRPISVRNGDASKIGDERTIVSIAVGIKQGCAVYDAWNIHHMEESGRCFEKMSVCWDSAGRGGGQTKFISTRGQLKFNQRGWAAIFNFAESLN